MDEEQDKDSSPEQGMSAGDLKSPKKPFSKLAVELSTEDLQSSGVQKMLLAEISRLEYHASKYDSNRELLSVAEQKCAVLEERQEKSNTHEVLYSVGLAVGSGLIGLTPSIGSSSYGALVVLGFGVVLIGVAIAAKWRRK